MVNYFLGLNLKIKTYKTRHTRENRIDLLTDREAFSAKFNQRFRHENVPLWCERVQGLLILYDSIYSILRIKLKII